MHIDIEAAHPARIHDYLVGGEANFPVDREAVDQAAAVLPGGLETARRAIRSVAAFQARAVRYLVAEAGIVQLLKLGTAVPEDDDVHEIAQATAPGTRVVYVGDDPTVLAQAHSFLRTGPAGGIVYVNGTLLDIEAIIRQASVTLDLSRPVAVLLPGTLSFVADEDDPYGIMAQLIGMLPSGSYLVLTHTGREIRSQQMEEAAERFSKLLREPYVVRTRAEIARFLDGLDLIEPGLVQIDEWRPPATGTAPAPPSTEPGADTGGDPVPMYAAVARKP
jgi:hypothetical protein